MTQVAVAERKTTTARSKEGMSIDITSSVGSHKAFEMSRIC
jgi:hypothetical protein